MSELASIASPVESFRDSVSTIDKKGKRVWIFPRKPKGKYHTRRIFVSIILLGLLFSGPFLTLNGHPFLLLNIIERKFILFGSVFWPQDFFLVALIMITTAVSIILFTISFGRLWCGWACPQTIFMEMVFRKIEYWIEGDASHQKKLAKQEWNSEKLIKKSAKHAIFFFISFLIANTFLAYIIGKDELFKIISEPVSEHLAGFFSITVFTGIFYGVFAHFREQACIVVCPYGRLQGVLLDKNSVVIGYDYLRGEKRAKFKKNEQRIAGDCIDCNQCVDVCPTGIDIRNGTQLECINCTACMDACDFMMEKVNLKKGLIRYTSENDIAANKKFKTTPKILGYAAVLTILISAVIVLLTTRSEIDAVILRKPGMMYLERKNGDIANLYEIKIINKTFDNYNIKLESLNPDFNIEVLGPGLELKGHDKMQGEFFLVMTKNKIAKHSYPTKVKVTAGENIIEILETKFVAPVRKS